MTKDELLNGKPIEIEVYRQDLYWQAQNTQLNNVALYKFKAANLYGLAAYTAIVELPNGIFDPEHAELSNFCPVRGLNGVDSLATSLEWDIMIGGLPYEFEGISDGYIGVHFLLEAITDLLDVTWEADFPVLLENEIQIIKKHD